MEEEATEAKMVTEAAVVLLKVWECSEDMGIDGWRKSCTRKSGIGVDRTIIRWSVIGWMA